MNDLDEFKRINTRPASVVTIGGFRPTRRPTASHFGLTPVGFPGEEWPQDEFPYDLICQLNLKESPFVPDLLQDLALITVFMNIAARKLGKQNGDGWLIRAYSQLDDLVPLNRPAAVKVQRGFELRYDLAQDHPVYDDPDLKSLPGFDSCNVHLENIHRTKIGGYASNIQSEQWWDYAVPPDNWHSSKPRYCFQIASEDKVALYWGDNGILYFARGTAPGCESEWFLDSQCY